MFVGTRLCVYTTRVLSLRGFPPLWELLERGQSFTSNRLWGSTHDFFSWLPPEVFSTMRYFSKSAGFEIIVFPLLGVLSMATEPSLPVCQLYHWHLSPNKWSSPATMSLDPIVVTAFQVIFPGESLGPATCGFPAIVQCQRRGQRRRQGNQRSITHKFAHFVHK